MTDGATVAWFHCFSGIADAMALGAQVDALTVALIAVFLFLAVWVPCCTSDIVFPLLFARREPTVRQEATS